jgi:hypothetical protein
VVCGLPEAAEEDRCPVRAVVPGEPTIGKYTTARNCKGNACLIYFIIVIFLSANAVFIGWQFY